MGRILSKRCAEKYGGMRHPSRKNACFPSLERNHCDLWLGVSQIRNHMEEFGATTIGFWVFHVLLSLAMILMQESLKLTRMILIHRLLSILPSSRPFEFS